eukprot:Skav214632  [mRNA]  locus=scaffold1009:50331:62587:- [translate_table: standard]
MEEVKAAQKAWSDAIKKISKIYLDGGDYVAAAANAAGELYGYGHGNVLFKPTKAKDVQFRPEASQAMSYFVGAKAVKQADGIAEDGGFAINGGKGWSDVAGKVVFYNHKVELNGNVAIAMGNYYFTSAADGSKTKVEYTFGYKKCQDGKVRIFLHHSSVPFSTQPESVSMEEVKAAQKAWSDAIKNISKTYLDGGDYVAAAANAAGELYGYGHGNVLFKPTKAKDVQFRPEASQAMSYFVGAKAVKQADGIAEDGGFAINGGKGRGSDRFGWQDVVFENHNVELNGNVAIAMGNYYFTSAADGSKTKVEYTFGYKKTKDGKVRIFLHHSSVPFNAEATEAKTALKQEVANSAVPTSVSAPGPVSMGEVKAAQGAWADAIKKISKTYLDGGDYVAAAANAAGELYGYGHGKVLFKPTKAKDVQFRPEASQAMSYFVGAKAVKEADGIAEDGGFAINGGKGWLKTYKGNITDFVRRCPEAKSYLSLTSEKQRFVLPEPGMLEGVKSKGKKLLKMQHVTYTYPGNETPTLYNVSIEVSLLSRVAVIGPNGAGKSTMIKALVGELPITGKSIVWKHPNVRISYVAQHAFHHVAWNLDECL